MVKPKARRKQKTELEVAQGLLLGYVNVLDAVFTRATGKSMKGWLEEFRRQPRELPPGPEPVVEETEMPLDWAYAVMGLSKDAPMEEMKKRYRALAFLYHPDKLGGSNEAFKILERARKRIEKEKRK